MSETLIMKKIMAAASRAGARIFRNNVGKAWIGQSERIMKPGMVYVNPGDIVVRQGRRIEFGLGVGSSDNIGWKSIVITPSMVGKRVAVFTAIESKTDKGRASEEQKNFICRVQEAGGFAGIARNEQQALEIFEDSLV